MKQTIGLSGIAGTGDIERLGRRLDWQDRWCPALAQSSGESHVAALLVALNLEKLNTVFTQLGR